MLEQLVGPFLQSGAGGDLLKQLQGHGLTPDQATNAVVATAEGASQQAQGGGLEALAGSLPGGLGGMLGGMLGGSGGVSTPGSSDPMVAAIAPFVAQKTGLDPAMAAMVVGAILPKLKALLTGGGGDAAAAPSLGGALGGLFK